MSSKALTLDGTKVKNIMRRFRLDEISAVDDPAQAPAKTLIMKRNDPVDKGLVDMVTTSEEGHQHGVEITYYDDKPHIYLSHAAGPDGEHHNHDILVRDGEFVITENVGHTHELDADMVQRAMMTLALDRKRAPEKSGKTAEPVGNTQPTEIDMAAENAAHTAEIQKRDAQIDQLNAIVNLTPEHRAHYESLTKSAKSSFLNAEEADRDAAIEKALAANPVVYTAEDGTEFRKKDDAKLIAMAKKFDEQSKELAIAKVDNQQAAFEKTATDQLNLLPGETIAKVALLKGIAAIEDKEIKEQAVKILADANKIAGMAFTTVGKTIPSDGVGAPGSAQQALDAMVEKVKTEEGLDTAKAYEKVLGTSQGAQLQQLAKRERRALAAQA